MLLLNFAHPLTDEQIAQVHTILGKTPSIRQITTQIDRQRPLAAVASEMINAAKLSADEWQTQQIIINPPGLAPLAVALVAEIHGRCGYFVPMLNIRPVADATTQRYEVAEIINLQHIRDFARTLRQEGNKS